MVEKLREFPRREQVAIFEEIFDERQRQDAKWGPMTARTVSAVTMVAVLSEEVGEVAQDVLKMNREGLRQELIQVAAVAMAMIEGIDAGRLPFGFPESEAG